MEEHELTPEEKLQAENELLKLKMMAEFGANFNEETTSEKLSPAIENEWLNHIYNFEKLHSNAERIKLYDFIGKPEYKPENVLFEQEISVELERITGILHKNNIVLDCICEYDDRTIYKFITEELFEHEMDNVRIEGMFSNFIYEEFHPNHEYDLKKDTDEFIHQLLETEWNEYSTYTLPNKMIDNGIEISIEEFSKKVVLFQKAWKSFEITNKEINHVAYELEKGVATVIMQLQYSAYPEKGNFEIFSGKASFGFKYEFGYWYLNEVSVPGFNDR
jgi:hypothetical protein